MELLCIILTAMQLMMYIGNDLIESVQLHDESIPKPGYVGNFKRRLKIKYHDLIRQYASPPEFLVTNILPQSNTHPSTLADSSKKN